MGNNFPQKMMLVAALAVGLVSMSLSSGQCLAQPREYPDKTIKLVVGTQPGGLIDLGARAWSDEFAKRLGVPVVISNQGGGGGTLALTDVSKASPDGYTLVAGSQTPTVIAPALTPNLPYNASRDFAPIGAFGVTPSLIVVNASSPFKTVEELLDYAKKNPGKLNCGTAGVGTISHFDMELVKATRKIDLVHVPFKGSTPAVTALLGNHVDLLFITLPALPGHLKAGRMRGLATTTKIKQFPEIPLYSEKGLNEAGMETWAALFAPAKIPKNVHQKLSNIFAEVVKNPAVAQKLESVGFTPRYINPDSLAKLIKEESTRAAEIVQKAGIKAD